MPAQSLDVLDLEILGNNSWFGSYQGRNRPSTLYRTSCDGLCEITPLQNWLIVCNETCGMPAQSLDVLDLEILGNNSWFGSYQGRNRPSLRVVGRGTLANV